MERNVVSLETAKQLKAAGFPQTAEFNWSGFIHATGSRVVLTRARSDGGNTVASAPTAQEIADQIGEEVKVVRLKRWYACDAARKSTIAQMAGEGDTMAEALAALWLKLNKDTPHDTQSTI